MTKSYQPDRLWGIHMPIEVGSKPQEEGFIGLGWPEVGDAGRIPKDRDLFKQELASAYPDAKRGAIPVWAGILFRFVHEMTVGDGVIYPSKHDRRVNLGVIDGECTYHPEANNDATLQRRKVRWLTSFPRANFSQTALHEIGSALTLFQVSNNAEEFQLGFSEGLEEVPAPDDANAETVSEQIAENTDDYVLKRLKTAITPYDFEQFTANLLEAMGYHARVTKQSGDGGIDVIAHRDELGFEPPLIKVQCKQTFNTIGRPDIQKLDGAIAHGEFGMFITLGNYSSDAWTYEQMKPNMRLIDGQALSELIYRHYTKFSPAMQRIIPLKMIYVPGPHVIE